MGVNTVNYDPSLEDRLRHPIQHLYRVTVYPQSGASFELAVDDALEVAFSMAWAPYAQASVTVKTPRTAAERTVLDGRLRTYVGIELGYALSGSSVSMNEAVRLRIQDVDEDVLAGTMTLTLQGREMEAQGADWVEGWNGAFPTTGIREAIEWILGRSQNGSVVIDNPGTGLGYRPDLVAGASWAGGTDLWSIASGIASSASLKLWHDGGSTWKMLPRYNTTGDVYATMLRTGKTGTITSINRSLSRTPWVNRVILNYENGVQGYASITYGTYGWTTVGFKSYTQSAKGFPDKSSADAAARAMLATLSARGYSYTIQAAAAYWIRPGMTVPVKTGRGPYEKQIVESVKFDPLSGLMTIDTIKNEDVVIA
jgi:hypothetical protein